MQVLFPTPTGAALSTREPARRLRFICCAWSSMAALLALLAGCDGGPLPEPAAIATATACNCGCFPYNSRSYSAPSLTPTPTGTWRPPTATPTRTPTRPSGSYATLVPVQPTEPPAWPPPAVTCTPGPGQPTSTPRPTHAPPVFPTMPLNTPMPSRGTGSSLGRALASMSGNAGVGQPTIDDATGAAVFAWSQDNTNPATSAEHRVYVRALDPQSGTLNSPVAANVFQDKRGFKATYQDSAVAVTPDHVTNVLYCDRRQAGDLTDAVFRRSTLSALGSGGLPGIPPGASSMLAHDAAWTEPVRVGEPSSTWCNSLRLKAAPDGVLFAVWAGGPAVPSAAPDSHLRVWRRSAQGEWRDVSPPRVTPGRQFEADIAFVDAGEEGSYRTYMVFDDGHNVYATWSDTLAGEMASPGELSAPDDSAWQGWRGWRGWRPAVELVSSDRMNSTLGIRDYWPSCLRLLSFSDRGRKYVYAFWSLYSTGRISYVYTANAGESAPAWTSEDALAYFPPSLDPDPIETPEEGASQREEGRQDQLGPAPTAGPGFDAPNFELALDEPGDSSAPGANVSAKVHMPQPFWVPERSRILVVYRYGAPPNAPGEARSYFAAYAYALPDAPGTAWQGAVGPDFGQNEPLRAFPPTRYEAMDQLQGAGELSSNGAAWLSWMERGASKEAFFGAIWPYTLISANSRP